MVFFDALRVKIRDEGLVKNKAVYVALALNPDGEKDVLGLWIEQTEGAKFWLKVVNELKARGVNDILIAVVDGLKGFPEAITSVFPQTVVQTCIVGSLKKSSLTDSVLSTDSRWAGARHARAQGTGSARTLHQWLAATTHSRGSCAGARGPRARSFLAETRSS